MRRFWRFGDITNARAREFRMFWPKTVNVSCVSDKYACFGSDGGLLDYKHVYNGPSMASTGYKVRGH